MHIFIPFTSDDEIATIGNGLLTGTLPKPAWTHAAHVAAAMWLLTSHPELETSHEMPRLIRAYNEVTGVANTDTSGYHETITQASLRACRAFIAVSPAGPLFEICNALITSPLGKADWLLAYWSRPRLFSVEARRAWLDPDIQEFPF